MNFICRIAAFGFLIYALTSVTPAHPVKASQPTAAAPNTSVFREEERRAAAQEGLSAQDKDFLMTAYQGEVLQLELSRIAMMRAKNPAVRRFAGTAAQYVGGAEIRLFKVASEFGVSLPATLPDEVQKAVQELTASPDIDRVYLQRVIDATKADAGHYKQEGAGGQNPVVAQFAREILPRITQHLRGAERLLQPVPSPVARAVTPRVTRKS